MSEETYSKKLITASYFTYNIQFSTLSTEIIISASRRTDIPSYYSSWFINRLRAGYVLVQNPFNAAQIRKISLNPHDVAAIVFWTRDASNLLLHINEIRERGFSFIFQYTITPKYDLLEPNTVPLEYSAQKITTLANITGPNRIIWRYDPIILSKDYDFDFHISRFSTLCKPLQGAAKIVKVSMLQNYSKVKRSFKRLKFDFTAVSIEMPNVQEFLRILNTIAIAHGFTMHVCCGDATFDGTGIERSGCISPEILHAAVGEKFTLKRDLGQRSLCNCLPSIDIGAYSTCIRACAYCYATRSFASAQNFFAQFDQQREILKLP